MHGDHVEGGVEINVSSDSAPTTSSSFARKLKKKWTNFALLGYSAGFLLAAIISLGVGAFACALIWYDFQRGAAFSISGWAQSVITFIMGAWITDRPRLFKKKSDHE